MRHRAASAREQTGQPDACDGGEEAKCERINHRDASGEPLLVIEADRAGARGMYRAHHSPRAVLELPPGRARTGYVARHFLTM